MAFRIGLDFDDTCVRGAYPAIGDDVPFCVYVLKRLSARNELILYTARTGKQLDDARQWFDARGINITLGSQKPNLDLFIDDRSLLGLPMVGGDPDWKRIESAVEMRRAAWMYPDLMRGV